MDILEEIKEIVSSHLDQDKDAITEASNFTEDLGADSLAIVELVLAIEEKFDIEIPDEDTEKIQTVGDAVAYIKQRA